MNTPQAPRPATRQRLLDAAWDAMCADGLRAATSRRITADAAANLGAITYHFGSKDDLIIEAALSRLRSWTEPLANALVLDEEDGGTRTQSVIPTLLEMVDDVPAGARALLEAALAADVGPKVRDAMRDHLNRFQTVVAELMRRRQDRGEIPLAADPVAMAGMFTAFALGLITQDSIGANPAPLSEIINQFLLLLSLATDRGAGR